MPFAIVQAGSSLQAVSLTGTVQTLSLPSGVTIDATRKGRFHTIGNRVVFTGAATINLWIDPKTFAVRSMVIQAPTAGPTLAAAGTGLTGDYVAAYSFATIDSDGNILNESGISPLSDVLTLTNQGINWTALQVSPDSSVNARILYRSVLGANGEDLFKVTTILDNVTTSYLGDILPDSALELLPVFQNSEPPPGTVPGSYVQLSWVYRDRLFLVGEDAPDEVVWSEPNLPYLFPDDNGISLTIKGEDEYGCTGVLVRRSECVLLKRARVLRFIGDDNENFEVQPDNSSSNAGCLAPRSCLVVDDIGYFLGPEGVYAVDSNGVRPITDDTVYPWFNTDLYFNRDRFPDAEAGYNPSSDCYELHLVPVAGSDLNEWISLDVKKQKWYGRHFTDAFIPESRGMLKEDAGALNSVIGGQDGYLYLMNQDVRSDFAGDDPTTAVAIAINWTHSFFDAENPDLMHFWGQVTLHYQNEGALAGNVTVNWVVGDIGSSFTGTQAVPLSVDRYRMTRFGVGRLMRMQFIHATAGENFLLRGIQVPFNVIGRR